MSGSRLDFTIHLDHRHAALIRYAARLCGLQPTQLLELILKRWFREVEGNELSPDQLLNASVSGASSPWKEYVVSPRRVPLSENFPSERQGELPVAAPDATCDFALPRSPDLEVLDMQRLEIASLHSQLRQDRATRRRLVGELGQAADGLSSTIAASRRRIQSLSGLIAVRAQQRRTEHSPRKAAAHAGDPISRL